MKLADLELGDLIFYKNDGMNIIEHVAIFLCTKNKMPYVIHATTAPHNSVMATRLKTDDFESSCVVRAKNQNLSREALTILLSWVEFQLPYANEKKCNTLLNNVENNFNINLEVTSSAPSQAQFGLFASIKKEVEKDKLQQHYNDMFNALPYVTKYYQDNGVRCAEVIVLAYNLALLKMNVTMTIDHSDNPFPFNSENALAAGLFYYCTTSPEHWTDLGILDKEGIHNISIKSSDQSSDINIKKAEWTKFKEELCGYAKTLIDNYTNNNFQHYSERIRSRTISYSSYSQKSTEYSQKSNHSESFDSTSNIPPTLDLISKDEFDLSCEKQEHSMSTDLYALLRSATEESICSSPNLLRQSPLINYFTPASPYTNQKKGESSHENMNTQSALQGEASPKVSSFSIFIKNSEEKHSVSENNSNISLRNK